MYSIKSNLKSKSEYLKADETVPIMTFEDCPIFATMK